MRAKTRIAGVAAAMLLAAAPATADFRKVQDKTEFTALIQDRELTRLGITISVSPQGQIRGKAFGRNVTGGWSWQDGYFCRDLKWGQTDIGYNCQMVERNGRTLRFTSDRGAGDSADLSLR